MALPPPAGPPQIGNGFYGGYNNGPQHSSLHGAPPSFYPNTHMPPSYPAWN
eukprot:NODE_7617_length_447_cov_52.580402_g6754_i1.p3 GENE.NODE_7617_length_447_cov_52.580402_g6754_i1~~NODE_7617_length_447_cov_52.580402_g6754_i1.p3  ORF type:complete len:51 (+),score=12.11 NODE_7617_length_447_cov_52.580402_g6754_i1:161-313(+)